MDLIDLSGTNDAGRIIDGLNFTKFAKGKWSPKAWYLLYHTESSDGTPVSVLRQRPGIESPFHHTILPGTLSLADFQEYMQ